MACTRACVIPDCNCDELKNLVDNQGGNQFVKCSICSHINSLHRPFTDVDKLIIKELTIAASISCHSLIPMSDLSTYSKQFSIYDLIPIPPDEFLGHGGSVCCTCDGYRTDYEMILSKYHNMSCGDVCLALPSVPCSTCTHPLLTHHIIDEEEKQSSFCKLVSSQFVLPQGSLLDILFAKDGMETDDAITIVALLPDGKLLLNPVTQSTLTSPVNNRYLLELPQKLPGTHIASLLINNITVVAVATDKEVCVFTSLYPGEVHTVNISNVTSLALWPQSTYLYLYAATWEGVANVMAISYNQGRILSSEVHHTMMLSSGVTCSTLSHDTRYLYVGTQEGDVYVYNTVDFTICDSYKCCTADITCIANLPQIKGVAIGSADNNIQVLSVEDNTSNATGLKYLTADVAKCAIKPVTTLKGHLSFVGAMGIVGPHLVSIGWDAQLISWPLPPLVDSGATSLEIEPSCCYKVGPQYHTMLLPRGLWNISDDTFAIMYVSGSRETTLALYRYLPQVMKTDKTTYNTTINRLTQ